MEAMEKGMNIKFEGGGRRHERREHMDRIDILGIQRRMAILSNERDLLFEKLKKEIPVNREEHPEVHEAYQKLFDVFIYVIKAEAKSLG